MTSEYPHSPHTYPRFDELLKQKPNSLPLKKLLN